MAPTTRARSKATSVASEDTGPNGGSTLSKKMRTIEFDPVAALHSIVTLGETAAINKLTASQCKAVLRLAAEEVRASKANLHERDDRIEQLTRERDEALARPRSKLRDFMFAQKLQSESPAPPATPQLATKSDGSDERVPPASEEPSQLRSSTAHEEMPAQTSSARESTPLKARSPEDTTITLDTPVAQTSSQVILRTPAQTEPAIPRWKALINSVGGYISPFSRKRPAPQEPESDTPKRARKDNVVITIQRPSAKDYRAPSSLSTVNERTEFSDQSTLMPDPTPSRPPKRKAKDLDFDLGVPQASSTPLAYGQQAPSSQASKMRDISFNVPDLRPHGSRQSTSSPVRATPQRRTVRDVIAARSARAGTPMKPRAWEGTPAPKEKNADARLEKLQRVEQIEKEKKRLEDELKELHDDSEVKDMVGHRLKRVKVDDLVSIPCKRPGDMSGTYGFPDLDSDDEIEVDEDAEIIKNVFEEAAVAQKQQEQSAAAPPPSTPAPVAAQATMTAPTPTVQITTPTPAQTPGRAASSGSMVDWESVAVGPKPADYVESTEEEKEAAYQKFKRQYEHFAMQLVVK